MKQIIIDVHHNGARVCVATDGILDEFWMERNNQETKLMGNIYKGKVVNVLQGMQACFVDIGRERNAYLYAGDVCVNGVMVSHNGTNAPEKFPLKTGDIIMCQVLKEEFGNKGARVTMNISLPGRMLVMSPFVDHVCVSRKIVDEGRKEELEKFVLKERENGYGFIVRTEASGSSYDEIKSDIEELCERWRAIKQDFLASPNARCVYTDCDLVSRAIRDMLKSDIDKVIINDKSTIEKLKREYAYLCALRPKLFDYYDGVESVFRHYRLDEQIAELLKKRVTLSNGSYLVIDRTEALTVIDVNTGKYVGDVNLEQTVYVTNKIAAKEIARQLRLRNLGGIIIVDFIDMTNERHRDEVLSILQEELSKDRLKCSLVGMTELGLVQITRKKSRSMLADNFLQPCPYCGGEGTVYNEELMLIKIRVYLIDMFKINPHVTAIKLFVHPTIVSKLFALRYFEKECAEEWADKRIYVIPDHTLHIEKFVVEKVTSKIIDLPDNAKLLY